MLVVETIAKIRLAHFVQGKPIKQICRELKLSRKVFRKVLRSDETCLVRLDNNKYSVRASAFGRPVEVRAYADRIELRQDGRVAREHARAFGRAGRSAIPGTTFRCWPANRER